MKLIKFATTSFIGFVAIIFFTVAMGAFMAPEMVMEYLKVEPVEESAYNSIRSIYGGLSLAFALFLAYAAAYMRKAGLGLIILYMGGFLLGRIYSFIELGLHSQFVLNWTFVEAALLIVSVLLLRKLVKASRKERLQSHRVSWN